MIINGSSHLNSEELLLLCIYQGDNEQAQAILQNSNSDPLVDGLGNTLLHFATEYGNLIMIKYLIGNGYQVDAVNSHGDTPLILALQQGDNDVICLLFNANATVLISNNQGVSAAGIVLNETEVSFWILEAFLKKVKAECSNDSLQTAQKLLQLNCPLPRAIQLKDAAITNYMLENGCNTGTLDIGYPNWTALHIAVRDSDLENVELLIEYGADVNARDGSGREPLYFANDKSVLKTLLDNGAKVIADDGTLVVGLLFTEGSEEIVKMLLQCNLDFHARDERGKTIFCYLVMNRNFNAIEVFKANMDNSFDVNERDGRGNNLLMNAAAASNLDIVEFALDRGAKVNYVDGDGLSALTYMLIPRKNEGQKIRTKIMMLLLEHGANAQLINHHQRTMLDYALTFKSFDTAKFIVAHLALIEELGGQIKQFVRTKIESHKFFEKYYDFCKMKIEKMNKIVICDQVSLFKLMTAKTDEIAYFADNNRLLSKVQTMKYYNRRSQLYYDKILQRNVRKIIDRAYGSRYCTEIM